jgi:sigma-B regulation protein RsbU (phosphoserine phosphatase)
VRQGSGFCFPDLPGPLHLASTAIFGLLCPQGDGFTLTLANGGHPPPLLLSSDGTADYQATAGGPLLGAFEDAVFTATTIRLNPGDTLLLYSDGLTDARTGPGRNRYGGAALRAFAASIAPATASAAVSAINVLLDGFGDGLDDDTAVLALGVPPA